MYPEKSVRQRTLDKIIQFPFISVFTGGVWRNDIFKGSSGRYKGTQYTESYGNKKDPRNGKYYSGGPFFTYRIEPAFKPRSVKIEGTKSGEVFKYTGPIVLPFDSSGYSGMAAPPRDDSYLDKVGTTAIAIVDPTNSNTQLGVALGELFTERAISLPAISTWRKRTGTVRDAGSEYLAAQFGWMPLVREVRSTAQTVRDGNKVLENYQAASGTLVHREFAFDDIVSESETLVSPATRCVYSSSTNIPAFNASPVPLVKKRRTVTSRWFSGSFTYANADASTIGKCLGLGTEADKLFGLTLTPDVLWELAPWSWALDWFSNTGDVIHNATSFGLAGLVMEYGYVMEETTTTDTYSMPATGLSGVSGPPPDAVVTSVTKRRREANPFGFGLTWEGLSPTQLAITAALGITHLR